MGKVNLMFIICRSATSYFQLDRVILKKVVTRLAHIWQFFGFGFWRPAEWRGQILGVVNLGIGG